MKRLYLLLGVILCTSLWGCSQRSGQTSNVTDPNLERKVAELEEENENLKMQIEELMNADKKVEDTQINKEIDTAITEIKEGDTITTERMEVKIKKVELTYDVLPDDTSGFYTHYPADSGNVYIHIDTDIKNLQKQNLDCDNLMVVEADYNDGFTYHSSTIPEDSSTGFTYANITTITPLKTLGVRFLIEGPQEIEETENALFLTFTIDKQEYRYTIR
jgi:hypothetical protein